MPRNGAPGLPRDNSPISSSEAARLFADLKGAGAVVLAVSGGPDSTALLWLVARWRKRLRTGPKLAAVTIDHGLRKESAAEARAVKRLAASLRIPHLTLRWSGAKPSRGVAAKAREMRYAMLAEAARRTGAVCILTAHTRDDQAETFLMRLSRGSGLSGLAAMTRRSVRGEAVIVRPLLEVPKSRLLATLAWAKVAFADDPTNRDPAFARPRWRELMPALAREGVDARNIGRLTARLARANAALEAVADRAEQSLVQRDGTKDTLDVDAFRSLPGEIQLRLLQRAIDRAGYEGPAELGKVETLLDELTDAASSAAPRSFRRTLAGALVDLRRGTMSVTPAPPRRTRPTHP